MKTILEFHDDEEDRGRIALNSADAYASLVIYVDSLQQRAALSLDPGERSALNSVRQELKDKLQSWTDM